MSLEFLVENMSEEGFTKIDDALDIYTNERGEHYMFVTKKVPLPTELLNDEERWTFEGQKHFKIVLSLRLDASHCIVYNSVAKIYSYESTKILTGCGFNIHAPFRLDSHCHYLQECAFNDYILRHTAEAIGENLIYRLKSLDIREIYKIVYFEKRDVGILKYFYSYLADALQDRGIFYAYGPGKYMCPGEVLIACDEDLQLFGETLYEDKKLLISVEQKYEKWLIENFHMQRLRVADVLENIESIVQCDLFDDKLLGRVYSYLLANADLESEALHQKKILPVFDQDQILFVSGFEEDVYYLYDAQEAFSFAPNLKEKIDTLHEIVTFPDTFNRYEELGIKEYNQRNILQKLKKISQSTEDRTLKTEISKAILNQRKIDAENWNIVQDILMLPTSDGTWHMPAKETIFYPNALLIDLHEESLFLDMNIFCTYFRGMDAPAYLERAGVWFISDLREPVSNYSELFFALAANWQKYHMLLVEKRVDKSFFASLKEAAFIPVGNRLARRDEVIFVSHSAEGYQQKHYLMYAFKHLDFATNMEMVEVLGLRHMDFDKVSVTASVLNRFIYNPALTIANVSEGAREILDFIIAFFGKEELPALKDFEFVARKGDGLERVCFKELIFIDSGSLYHLMPKQMKKSILFFPLFEKKYVDFFAELGKKLSENLHISLNHHGLETSDERFAFFLPYISELLKTEYALDSDLASSIFYDVKDLHVKFTLGDIAHTEKKDFFVKGDHCFIESAIKENPLKVAQMYQKVCEAAVQKRLSAFAYEIEKLLKEGATFLRTKGIGAKRVAAFEKECKDSCLFTHEKKRFFEQEDALKKRVIDYLMAHKDISFNPSFLHKGYDFIEKLDGRKVYCSIKDNIDGQYIFDMRMEEIEKAEKEGQNYKVYLIKAFDGDAPVYDEVEDIARQLKEERILVSKAGYHLIMVQRGADG